LSLFVNDGIPQSADSIYAHLDDISGSQWPNAFRRAGGDQVAGQKSHHLGNVADYGIERKDEILSVTRLPNFVIDTGLESNPSPGIDFVAHRRSGGAECIESFGPGPLPIFILEITGGNVVHASVAKNVCAYIFLCAWFVTSPCYDNAEFTLMVDALRNLWTANVLASPKQ